VRRGLVAATAGGVVASLVTACSGSPAPSAKPARHVTSNATASPVGTPSAAASAPAHRPRLHVSRLPGHLPVPLAREAVLDPRGTGPVTVAGGLLAGDTSSSATYVLDLATGSATASGQLPVAVHDTAGAVVQGRGLVLGGGNASEQAVVQSRGPGGWRTVGRLPSPRSDLTAVSGGGGRVLVLGGYDGTSPALADVLVSRDGRRWRTFARLPVPVRYAATAVAGGAVWSFGGERDGAMTDVVQRVDLRTGQAAVVHHLRHPLGHAVAVPLGGRVLLIGGRLTTDRLTSRMWWFDDNTRRLTPAGRLGRPLADSAVVSRGSTAYLVGGETPALSDRVLRLLWR
jgi:hypothetical protein